VAAGDPVTADHASRPPLPDSPRARALRHGAIFADLAGQIRERQGVRGAVAVADVDDPLHAPLVARVTR